MVWEWHGRFLLDPEGASFELETVVQSVVNFRNQYCDPSGFAGLKIHGFGEGTIQTLPGKQNVDFRKHLRGGSVAPGGHNGEITPVLVAAGMKWNIHIYK